MKISPSSRQPTPIAASATTQALRVETAASEAAVTPRVPITVSKPLGGTEPATAPLPGAKADPTREEVARVVDKVNQTGRIFDTALRFEVAEGNRIKVRVIDANTGALVREIPPEKLLETFTRLEDVIGVLLDQRM